jgi:hypothetical protein
MIVEYKISPGRNIGVFLFAVFPQRGGDAIFLCDLGLSELLYVVYFF